MWLKICQATYEKPSENADNRLRFSQPLESGVESWPESSYHVCVANALAALTNMQIVLIQYLVLVFFFFCLAADKPQAEVELEIQASE